MNNKINNIMDKTKDFNSSRWMVILSNSTWIKINTSSKCRDSSNSCNNNNTNNKWCNSKTWWIRWVKWMPTQLQPLNQLKVDLNLTMKQENSFQSEKLQILKNNSQVWTLLMIYQNKVKVVKERKERKEIRLFNKQK